MIMTSIGQMNNETARQIYKYAGLHADSLVKVGRIAASERPATFAKLVAEGLSRANLSIPKAIATAAGDAIKVGAAPQVVKSSVVVTVAAKTSALQVAKGTFQGAGPVSLFCFVAEGCHTALKYVQGDIDRVEAGRRTVESAAVNTGGLGGGVAGAALGSAICPGVGTIIGSVIGGMGGAAAFGKVISRFTR